MQLTITELGKMAEQLAAVDTKLSDGLEADRARLVRLLETCVTSTLMLKQYLRTLQLVLKGHARHNGVTTIDRAEQLAKSGLSVLTTSELVQLALDPVSLWTLHDVISAGTAHRCTDRPINKPDVSVDVADFHQTSCATSGAEVRSTVDAVGLSKVGFPWGEFDLLNEQNVIEALGADNVHFVDDTAGDKDRVSEPPAPIRPFPVSPTNVTEPIWQVTAAGTFIVFLVWCRSIAQRRNGLLSHVIEPPYETREVLLPPALVDQLPWLKGLQIEAFTRGRRSQETRRYKAVVFSHDLASGARGTLRVALRDGTRQSVKRLTAAEPEIRFTEDFSADWGKLEVELQPEKEHVV